MPSTLRGLTLGMTGAGLLFMIGCEIDMEPRGPSQTETKSIELDKTELVTVDLRMGAGELTVRGGSSKLMDAEFQYNRLVTKPQVHYDASGFRGRLSVEEPRGTHRGTSHYRWDLRFNDEKPIDLNVDFGAGNGRLDIGSMALRSVSVNMGVGSLLLDLRGTVRNDYTVRVHGGVGEATVYLPAETGIEATATGGIGGINARGLHKRDGRYTNDAYGHAKTTVRLDIQGGIGTINLISG